MTGGAQIVPRNVQRFEIFVYLSLLIDALSFPFREVPDNISGSTEMAANFLSACLILLFSYLVWLAARKKQNWARWGLLVSFVLSVLSLFAVVSAEGWTLESLIDLLSAGLTGAGLYYSFTGDAKFWFAS